MHPRPVSQRLRQVCCGSPPVCIQVTEVIASFWCIWKISPWTKNRLIWRVFLFFSFFHNVTVYTPLRSRVGSVECLGKMLNYFTSYFFLLLWQESELLNTSKNEALLQCEKAFLGVNWVTQIQKGRWCFILDLLFQPLVSQLRRC